MTGSGGHVPGAVAEGDRRAEGGVGQQREVGRGGSEHPDALRLGREGGVDRQHGRVAGGGVGSGAVVADRDDRLIQPGRAGDADRVAVPAGAETVGRPVRAVELGQGDDPEQRILVDDQGEEMPVSGMSWVRLAVPSTGSMTTSRPNCGSCVLRRNDREPVPKVHSPSEYDRRPQRLRPPRKTRSHRSNDCSKKSGPSCSSVHRKRCQAGGWVGRLDRATITSPLAEPPVSPFTENTTTAASAATTTAAAAATTTVPRWGLSSTAATAVANWPTCAGISWYVTSSGWRRAPGSTPRWGCSAIRRSTAFRRPPGRSRSRRPRTWRRRTTARAARTSA